VWITAIAGTLLLVFAVFVSLSLGVVQLSPAETMQALFRPGEAETMTAAVVWSIRLPRIIVAMLVGAALATVGAVMQAILRNPLAEPGITGVSAGAAVGAVAGITFGLAGSSQWGIPLAAFAGAAAVSLILQTVLQTRRDIGAATIILVGVSISALAGAIINLLIANARDDSLVRSALFWLAGDLELRSWDHVLIAIAPILLGLAYLFTRIHALDALSLGEQTAATSGVNVARERTLLLLVASLVTGAAVAVSGVISFVGLVVPHAVRLVVGASHSRLLPLSALGGALFLVLADTAARAAFGPVVVQTGVVAALVGAPVFLILLLRRRPS
jgi:iron complex transport system permease protein